MDFDTPRRAGLIAILLDEDDDLIDVKLTNGQMNVILGTRLGMAINFPETGVRPMGRSTRGVRGITLHEEDVVVGMDTVRKDCELLTVTEAGYGKRTALDEYRVQTRGGKGIINNKITEKTGQVVGIKVVRPGQELMLITGEGVIIRFDVAEISVISRNTQGVRVMRIDENDKVVAVAAVEKKVESD